jgi:RND family efflux transporter MFP subunit
VTLPVRAGERVKAGQVLLRIDARAAEQTAAAGAAQVLAARTAEDEARRELQRQRQLFEKGYISQAALDRAEAGFRSTQAQTTAQVAAAGAAQTQSGFYVVKAPYDALVSEVAVVLGDMAMPGRPLLTLYDPAVLRVSVSVPQATAGRAVAGQPLTVELPTGRVAAVRAELLPAADPSTHTLELRLDLPARLAGVAPGMFARVWLPAAGGEVRLFVPVRSVVRRAELSAVYVVDGAGRPLLRQVRLGRVDGERVEVLAGIEAGERVVLDPQAATRLPAKDLP